MACRRVRIGLISFIAALLPVAVAPAFAQPWVPPKGEGTVSVTYQNYYVTGHFVGVRGIPTTDTGATHSKSLVADMKQISRRSALYFAATTPALAVSIHPAILGADPVLLELGPQFDAISAQLDHGALCGLW